MCTGRGVGAHSTSGKARPASQRHDAQRAAREQQVAARARDGDELGGGGGIVRGLGAPAEHWQQEVEQQQSRQSGGAAREVAARVGGVRARVGEGARPDGLTQLCLVAPKARRRRLASRRRRAAEATARLQAAEAALWGA